MTELDKFKDRHPGANRMLRNIAIGFVAGTIITAATHEGAGTISSFSVRNDKVAELAGPGEGSLKALLPSDRVGRPAPKLDIDEDLLNDKTFVIDAYKIDTLDAINDRADAELRALNVLRNEIKNGAAFDSPLASDDQKADVIAESMRLATEAAPMFAAAAKYDNHLFTLSEALPKTTVLNDVVETLNWKRKTVLNSVAALEDMVEALRNDNDFTFQFRLGDLSDIMDNYEFVAVLEESAEAIEKELESSLQDEENEAPAGYSWGSRKTWDISVKGLQDMGRTYGAGPEASAKPSI